MFHCAVCNWDMCPNCFAGAVGVRAAGQMDVRHPHVLVWQAVYPNVQRGAFRCDACGQPGRGEAWHCEPCRFDLHAQCLRPR